MVKRAKKARTFGASKPCSGGRFNKCVQSMAHRKGVKDARAVCGKIGRAKYGAKRMAKWSAAGRKWHA